MRATRAPLSVKVGCPNPNFPLLKGRLSFFKEQITAKGKKKKRKHFLECVLLLTFEPKIIIIVTFCFKKLLSLLMQ